MDSIPCSGTDFSVPFDHMTTIKSTKARRRIIRRFNLWVVVIIVFAALKVVWHSLI